MVYRMGSTPAGTCPRCRETLLGVRRENLSAIAVEGMPGVRWCEACGGVMVDVASSKRVITTMDRDLVEIGFQASTGRARKKDDGRHLTCPECLTPMAKTRIESAACEVDACPSHGTWFDAGELYDVMRAFAQARRHGVVTTRSAPNPDAFRPDPKRPAADVAPPAEPPREATLLELVLSFLGRD